MYFYRGGRWGDRGKSVATAFVRRAPTGRNLNSLGFRCAAPLGYSDFALSAQRIVFEQ